MKRLTTHLGKNSKDKFLDIKNIRIKINKIANDYVYTGCEVAVQVDPLGTDEILNHEAFDHVVDNKKRLY